MNALECKAYLERIGYQEEPHTDKDCLEKLMELQLQSVPFENLEVFKEKRVPSLKTEDIFHKIVHQGRGGYCFELNKIFYELLKGLGFDVTPLAIRMLWSPDDLRRILHRATMVVLEDGPYFCDVGYGGPGPRYPVKLEDGLHTEKNGSFRVTMEPQDTNGEILMEILKQSQYSPLDVADQVMIIYAAAHDYLKGVAREKIRQLEEQFYEFMDTNYPEVKSIYLMSGAFDFAIFLEGKTLKEVSMFVSTKLSTLEAVAGTATHFVLKKYKDHGMILIDKEPANRMKVTP